MTLNLSEYVSGGEIINLRKNSVHGYLALRGCDRPIVLQLTGNCSDDLAGSHIRFEKASDDPAVTEEEMNELKLGWIQIGVTGEMTAKRQPAGLYLEWFGQNGHTIIEVANATVEFVEDDEDELLADDNVISIDDDSDDDLDEEPAEGSQITSFERTDGGDAETWNAEPLDEESEEEEDPFGLFPKDLSASLGASAPSWNSEPDEATLAQWKEWDEVFDGTKDVPLSSLFDPPLQLPPVDSLTDPQVTDLFRKILMQLARHNVAFHMCEHFDERSGYKLLVEEILREYGTHPELPRIGYTMNFDTSEHCEQCTAEFDRRYSEREAQRELDDPDSDIPDEDTPF